jgi:hypothetical protein
MDQPIRKRATEAKYVMLREKSIIHSQTAIKAALKFQWKPY